RPDVCRAIPRASSSVAVVFVANGSGDFRTVSANLRQVVAQTGAPLQIETVLWSRGYGRYVTDHLDHANHLVQGARLAAEVIAYRQAYPGHKVHLVGHSAGRAVVLSAAESLPTCAVDVVLLPAPAVCIEPDL